MAPSSAIQGALTGFEFHLLDRNNMALRLFVTVAFSAVFGALLQMIMDLPLIRSGSNGWPGPGTKDPSGQPPVAEKPAVDLNTPPAVGEDGQGLPSGKPAADTSSLENTSKSDIKNQ
ncbi:hypothetical protein H8F21_14695 [Pseudomonas sp. P66]|uniref:Preprotein translocase subunit SecG n=1 Tax=Pseudomonas arcuscaelestis TaxID=2710591 RepID=A0ABS2BYZ2_9PSED|nr:hypothetical protein [Pseudomonas arcuscaelestis]MBM5458814.1 hypothetical protein [Pseudomonas arcuscaelestis]